MAWSIELVLGLIGTVTGCISFGYNLYRFIEECVSISIEFPDYENYSATRFTSKTCFFSAETVADYYQAPYRAFVQARIINNSSRPIHILEFRLQIQGHKSQIISNEYSVPADTYSFKVDNNNTLHVKAARDVIKPIIELPAFSAKEGLVFFPLIDKLDKDYYTAELIAVVSRKTLLRSRHFKSASFTLPRKINALPAKLSSN